MTDDFGYSYGFSTSYPYGDLCQRCWCMPCRCSDIPPQYTYTWHTSFTPLCEFGCGQFAHAEITQCPRVKEVLYFASGKIRRITFVR